MLAVPGRPTRCCDGLSRREWLRLGGLSTFGLGLPTLLAARDASAPTTGSDHAASFGRAKSCIVLFLFGAPAHQDTFDLKPEAPVELRGEFRPIDTAVPGLQVAEHLPRLAAQANQYALIRSVTHPDNTHTVAMHYMLTGVRHLRPSTNPQNAADDFPCFGAVANSLLPHSAATSSGRRVEPGLPAAVSLNAPANQVSANNHIFPGFFGGFLGRGVDPLFVPQNANAPRFEPLSAVDDAVRFASRRDLLANLEGQVRRLERTAELARVEGSYARAFDLLTSPAVRQAFSLESEPVELRERFGHTPFGQGCLLARRLVERGAGLVTVNWERDDAFWDTHANNFTDLRNKLLPNFDRGLSALLTDLRERGLLDETLVVVLGEFGRTPQINKNAGRDHWAPCNSVVLAGAGIQAGTVYGASDRIAAYPAQHPVRPEDLAATLYHLLGIDSRQLIHDAEGRPHTLSAGEPVWPLL